jgi:hypothetical protein
MSGRIDPLALARALAATGDWAAGVGDLRAATGAWRACGKLFEVRREHGSLVVAIWLIVEEAATLTAVWRDGPARARHLGDLRALCVAALALSTGTSRPPPQPRAEAGAVVAVDFKRRAAGERDDEDDGDRREDGV